MRFEKELLFDTDPSTLHALMADPGFRREVAERAGSSRTEVEEHDEDGVLVQTVDSRQPVPEMPAAAKALVGAELHVRQVERWSDETHATLEVTIPGRPGHIRGTVKLQPRSSGKTAQLVEAEARMPVPVVGGKLEQLMCRVIGHVLKLQAQVAAERLAAR